MKPFNLKSLSFCPALAFATLIAVTIFKANAAHADTDTNTNTGTVPALIDNFTDNQNNSLGIQRQFINDSVSGGETTTTQKVSDGVLSVSGEIAPPRGQPGWASSLLLLEAQGLPQDASTYEGVRLLIKINDGNISLSANSTDVTNFDYHAAPIAVRADGKFHEVKIPFKAMKRAWSEQTPLNSTNLNSLSIVAYSGQKDSFEFEVDEIGFY